MNLDVDGGSDGDGVELKVGMTRTVTYRANSWFDRVSRRQRMVTGCLGEFGIGVIRMVDFDCG